MHIDTVDHKILLDRLHGPVWNNWFASYLYIHAIPGGMASHFTAMLMILSSMLNFLQLNQDKTEAIHIGSKAQREKLASNLNVVGLNPSQEAKVLGVIFDLDFNFKAHVRGITKTAFYHLKNISKVRPFLSLRNTERLMHAFITSRLAYCNVLLSGLPKNTLNQLQLIQFFYSNFFDCLIFNYPYLIFFIHCMAL